MNLIVYPYLTMHIFDCTEQSLPAGVLCKVAVLINFISVYHRFEVLRTVHNFFAFQLKCYFVIILLLRHLLKLLLLLLPLFLVFSGRQSFFVFHEVFHPEIIMHDSLVIFPNGQVIGSIHDVFVVLGVGVRFEAVFEGGYLVLALGVPSQDVLTGCEIQRLL